MNEAINNDRQADKKARAKRADLEAMQARFDAIKKIISVCNVDEDGDALVNSRSVRLIYTIADGVSLDDLIVQAGRAALGLE